MIWIFTAVFFAVLSAALSIYILAMKKELRHISRELDRTSEQSYNSLVKIALFDRDINGLAAAVNRSISDHKRLKLQAEASERSLRRSVSDIAHDLRTPLSVVYGELQLMEKMEGHSDKALGYIHICLEKTAAMKKISDDFFELAVIESDIREADIQDVNLTDLLMAFIAENEGVIRMSGLEPEIVFPERTVTAKANEAFLVRMFGNLLNNILKFSADSFRITLSGNDENACIIFSNPVPRDHSIDVDMLFERTYQGDSSRRSSGSGLGLYIVKLLAQKQGLDVSAVCNDNELCITIDFPDARMI